MRNDNNWAGQCGVPVKGAKKVSSISDCQPLISTDCVRCLLTPDTANIPAGIDYWKAAIACACAEDDDALAIAETLAKVLAKQCSNA